MSVIPFPSSSVAELSLRVVVGCHANWLRRAAHQLAAMVETLDGLTPEQRCDLRGLPMQMLAHAEMLRPEGGS